MVTGAKLIFWLALFAIAEGGVNAYVLADAHQGGLVGALLDIVMFTAINIMLAFLIGYYTWGYLECRNAFKRVIGALVVMLLIGSIVCVSFILAHYRDALARTSRLDTLSYADQLEMYDKLGLEVILTFIQNPFLLEGMKSYLLLIISVIAAILITIKCNGIRKRA